MDVPETAAALKTLVEMLDDDTSAAADDESAAASATGASDGKTEGVAFDAEVEDFGLVPATQTAETESTARAKSTAWNFILSKGICGQAKDAEMLDIKLRQGFYPPTKVKNAQFGWKGLSKRTTGTPGGT